MGRTLANISRALSSYGRQSAGIHRSTARNVNWHQMRAADARARGIAQRGRNLSSMVSGLGQMVGQQMIQAPIRERQQEMQDLSLQQGKAGLKVQEEQLSQLKEARERRRKYIEIISENSGIFEKAIPRLREAGLHDEADSQLEKALGIQKLMASLSQTEKKEHLTNLRLIAESVGTIANAPDEERAGKVVAGKLYLKNVVGENPLIDELLPDNPTDGDYEEMRDFYTVTLDAEKIAARKDADLARAIKTQTLSDAQAKSDDEMMENALTHLNAISEKGFGTARKWQRGKLPESLRSQFDQLVGGSQAEARESIQAYLGIESPARSGTLGELDEARKEEPGLTLFQLLERKQTIRTPPEEEKDLNPAQALANLRYLSSAAEKRKNEDAFFELTADQIEQAIAKEKGWNIEELNAKANPTGQEQIPSASSGRMVIPDDAGTEAVTAATAQAQPGDIIEYKGRAIEKQPDGRWKAVN